MKPRKCRAPCNNTRLELHSDDKEYQERAWVCRKCGSLYLDAYGAKSPSFKQQHKEKRK